MGIDIDTSKKWMEIRRRANDMSQSTMDEAAQTGDYSKVDRMSSIMDRISALGDHHVQQIAQARDQDKAVGGEAPAVPDPMAMQGAPPPAPPTPSPTAPGLLPDMGSAVHEAARGATKGAIEAVRGGSALPPQGSLGYAPGDLSLEAGGLGRYAPGDLSFKSDFSPWNAPERKATQSAFPDLESDEDSSLGAGDLLEKARRLREGSALPSIEDQEVAAYLNSSPAERQAEMKERLNDLFGNKTDPLDELIAAGEQDKPKTSGLGYAPGELSLRKTPSPAPSQEEQTRVAASGSLGYAPGDLKMESALPPQSVEDQEVEAYLKSKPAEREAEMRERMKDLVGPKVDPLDDLLATADAPQAPAVDLPEEELQNRLRNYARSQPRTGLPGGESEVGAGDLLGQSRKLRGESALPIDSTSEESAQPESALPTFEEKPEEVPAGPSEADESAQLDMFAKAAPALTRKYKNNGAQLAKDFIKQGAMTDMEREYARRVMNELGPRPKLATVPKILAALAVGVGSVLGAWITGKYNGQALMDMGADQKEWDRQRADIGREVYQAHKLWDKTAMQMGGQMDRTKLLEAGKDDRQEVSEGGKNSRLATQEGGKNSRQKEALASHERIANIRSIAAKHGDQMSISDKAELSRLGRAYSGIDRTLMTVDPKVKAQGDEVLSQMEAIIQKYRDQGK